jgi:hypothetical protein
VAAATAKAAGLEGTGAERRHLALKGKTEAISVFVLTT